jgi:hypothetical protein
VAEFYDTARQILVNGIFYLVNAKKKRVNARGENGALDK